MRLLEISPGISINLDCIEVVQRFSDTETLVSIAGESHVTNIPYGTFVDLIRSKGDLPRNIQTTAEPTRALEQLARYQATPTP